MTNFRIFVFKIKSLIIPVSICLFILFLLLFSTENITSAKNGIFLWYNSVLPSLLPFFIATELISYTNLVPLLGNFLNAIMRPIFNVPGSGAFALILGIISGYPVGAKMVAKLKESGACSDIEAERLIAFTNNSGPLFIVGTVGIGIFLDVKIGLLLLFIHILSALTVGFLFRFWKRNKEINKKNAAFKFQQHPISFYNLGEVLYKSIFNSIISVVMIGGFIVLFSVIITMLFNSRILYILSFLLEPIFSIFGMSGNTLIGIITGFLEVTNGLFYLAEVNSMSIYLKTYITAFLLGFGGFSVLLQVLSITSKAHISIKPYFIGKFLQGTISIFYMFLLI